MDWLEELGTLALGSRLRRLGDTFVSQVATVYQEHGVELNPRFFPLVSLLAEKDTMGVTEIADALHLTHAAVSQMTRALEEDGWVKSSVAAADERKRNVSLTAFGRKQVEQLQPLWRRIRSCVNTLLVETDNDLLHSIALVESALAKKPFLKRINEENFSINGLSISSWDPAYKKAFYDLNADWIQQYFTIENGDKQQLSHPEENYIQKGGDIFFAKLSGTVVGTCAILETSPGSYELSKMAVSQLVQGRGVGKALLQHVITTLRKKGAREIWLETASVLKTAIALYKKLGFRIEPHPHGGSRFKRADVFMRLEI